MRGGFVTNWCARAGCDSIWLSVVELGVEVSERISSGSRPDDTADCVCDADRSVVSAVLASRSGVEAMSPGATVEQACS